MEQSTKTLTAKQSSHNFPTIISALSSLIDEIGSPDIGAPIPLGNGAFAIEKVKAKNIFQEKKRSAWGSKPKARCDFTRRVSLLKRGVWFISIWAKSLKGRTLEEIKSDDTEVSHFANEISELITEMWGEEWDKSSWALVTTPSRRHKERNFADLCCKEIASKIGIEYIKNCAIAKSRQRVCAEFLPGIIPSQPNIIVFDDIVTTGSTLKAMQALLKNKNLFFIVGINNCF